MINASESFPLKWPIGRARTGQYSRKRSAFKTSMSRARDGLIKELKMLGASNVVISTNIETYIKGGINVPYANQSKQHDDPGVAVYYSWKGEQYCLCCDKYKTVMENMQAVNKTIEAIRGIERWGTGEMMKSAFQGFKELPPADTAVHPWFILGVRYSATEQEIKAAYREKAKLHHPDMGGNPDEFDKIQNAYQEMLKTCTSN